ncbi:hypothetical protein JP35_08700 [Gallibacterium anatis]|uniref:hypothetical protein n=1 Tax=Gallibacterium anatis TaxID=750 RepID=UPI000530D9AA|nr:hypothetical protein [Gallibacterium anatis]KGQ38089.1 hypothetical protein JP35_08700 [Gallibacterium anatis]
MKSFKLTIILVLLLGGFGYKAASFAVCYFKTDLSNTSFLLVSLIIAPLTAFANTLKELRTDTIYVGLKESEKRRLTSIINTKRKQLYLLVCILVIPSIIVVLGLAFAPAYRNEIIYILAGAVLADIVCMFHFFAIVDDVNDFKIKLKNRADAASRKQKVLEEFKN